VVFLLSDLVIAILTLRVPKMEPVDLGYIVFQAVTASSVPALGGAMLLLLAFLLAFIGFMKMRSRPGHSASAIIGALTGGALLSAVGGVSLMQDVGASGGGQIVADQGMSKFQFTIGTNEYVNNSAVAQLVIELLRNEGCSSTGSTTECELGTKLAPGEMCSVTCPGFPSDARLKTDVKFIGRAENGLPLYEFRYIGGTTRYRGVMAQDVLQHTPDAVVTLPNGYLGVDYGMLGLRMMRVQ
jgi:hypothetical protein